MTDTDYIIKDTKSGKFVAYPGSASSFTRDILKARRFPSREAALNDACEMGERVIRLSDVF